MKEKLSLFIMMMFCITINGALAQQNVSAKSNFVIYKFIKQDIDNTALDLGKLVGDIDGLALTEQCAGAVKPLVYINVKVDRVKQPDDTAIENAFAVNGLRYKKIDFQVNFNDLCTY